jgi:hypothetical protein
MSTNSLFPSWASTISGDVGGNTSFTSTATTSDSFTYVGGHYISSISRTISGSTVVLPANTVQGIVVLKYTYGGIAISGVFATGNTASMTLDDMKTDLSNNIYITGTYRSTTNINFAGLVIPASGTTIRGFLIKLDKNLSGIWVNTINTTYDERGKIYIDTITNSILLAGIYSSSTTITLSGTVTLPTTNNRPNSCVIKYDLNGLVLYAKRIGNGTQPSSLGYSTDVTTDFSGNVYLVGFYENISAADISFTVDSVTFSPTTATRSYILRLSNTLTANLLQLFPTGTDANSITSITIDTSNNTYLCGNYFSTIAVTFGSVTLPIASLGAVFIVKCLSGGIAPNTGITIERLRTHSINLYNNNLFITGEITAAISRNLGNGVTLNSSSTTGIFLLKYNTNLIAQAAAQIRTTSQSIMYASSIDTSNNIYGAIQYGGGPYTLSGGVVIPSSPASNRGAGFIKYLDISPPLTPTGLTATSQQLAVNLNWNPSLNATEYKVYYGLSGSFGLSGIFTTTSATISGLTGGLWYNFQVSARNSAGESTRSTTVFSMPISATPTGLIATSQIQAIDLSWNSSVGATSYNIYYGLSGSFGLIINTTSTTRTISGLIPGTWYNFRVTALNTGGESTQSTSVFSMPIPTTPTGLSASPLSLGVSLHWNSTIGANEYKIYYGLSGSFGSTLTVSGLTTEISGLLFGSDYNFKISAINSNGNESPLSAAVFETPLPAIPATPTGLTASGIVNGVSLTWNSSVSADYYTIYYDVSGSGYGFTENFTSLSGTISPLTPGVAYNFKISATNDGGTSALSSPAYATPIYGIPATPTGFTATGAIESVDLSWNLSLNSTFYIVYYGTDGITFDSSATFLSTPGTINGLSGDVQYYFYIVGANPSFTSAPSSTITTTAFPPAPTTPTLLTATPTNTGVILNWSTSINATSYKVIYGISGTFDMDMTFVGTGTTQTIPDLSDSFFYNFKVRGVNSGAESADSNILYAQPLPPAPLIATPIVVYPIEVGRFNISFKFTVDPVADYYRIYYSEISGNFEIFIQVVEGDVNIQFLQENTTYYIKVVAYSGINSAESAIFSETTNKLPSGQTQTGNTNYDNVIERAASDTIFNYKEQFDSTGTIWQFRSAQERMAYIQAQFRNVSKK